MNKKIISAIVGIFFTLAATLYYFTENREKTVLLAILTQNKAYYLPKYLESIENLDYDKKLISIYIDTTNTDKESREILKTWAQKHLGQYRKIIIEHFFGSSKMNVIKNRSLQKAKETQSDFYFALDYNVVATPYTLKELVNKDKPIIAPLLHPIPEHNDIFSNFFADVNEGGYWKDHSDYLSILNRTKVGTFKVPLVHMAYLIKTDCIDQLNFGNQNEYDSIVFSRNARNNHIEQYVCNEKPFGVFVRFNGEMTSEEERKKFETIVPYINSHQEQSKKVIYVKTGYWGDIYNLDCPYYNKTCWTQLRSALQAAGYDMRQINSFDGLQDFERLIVFEIFREQVPQFAQYPKEKLISILWEPPSVLPQNYDRNFHTNFSRVYTWRDDLVDNNKYFKIAYPDLRPMVDNLIDFDSKKLATLVASNKRFDHLNELYTARRHVIDFYENNHSEDLDLYGPGWPASKVYKGMIPGTLLDKVDKLRSYRFCYAYENIRGEPGYITEKILNCFQAGCIPIYWGASNIAQYIPNECFISREEFKNDQELYDFIKNMKKEEYQQYIENIKRFLSSDQASLYTVNHFIRTFMSILKDVPQIHEDPIPSFTTYNFSKEPIDIVIPCIAKDKDTLELCIQGIKENCKDKIGRIIVVSPERLTDNAEWFDENKFPFDKKTIALEMFPQNEALANNYSIGWFYQQLLKLYAPFTIPELSSNVLILDSDTIFLNPVNFLNPSGAGLYNPGTEYNLPYFKHGFKLIPGFKRIFPEYSGISHHMLFQKPVLEDMFQTIKETHHMEPWKAICRCVDISESFFAASEYELYFNFLFSRTKQAEIRKLKWKDISHLQDLPKLKEEGYHYASAHSWMRR